MLKKIGALLLATSLFATPAYAHVMNGDNMYTDIAKSEDREAVLYTHSIHLIKTDSALYKPNDELAKKDFAIWYSQFKDLEGSDDQLIQQAVDKGIISSTEGTVTYGELNNALFNNEVAVEDEVSEVTRGDYAAFVAENATQKLKDGTTLLEQASIEEGPTGEIEEVVRAEDDSYTLKIDGKLYMLAEHPSVVNDSTDPLVWQGQQVTESLMTANTVADREGDGSESTEAKLQFISIDVMPKVEEPETQGEDVVSGVAKEDENEVASVDEEEAKQSIWTWVVAAVAVIIVGSIAVFFYRKNKK